jgi:ABC-2 type transport system ATP-binding protein
VVLATSYLDEAERATDVLALDAGRVLASGTPQEIVAAMPGTLRVSDARLEGEARRRAWRRGGRWRIWDPAPDGTDGGTAGAADGGTAGAVDGGTAGAAGGAAAPDLQDAVTVAILARELAGTRAGNGRPGGGPR